jgi:hypothetical protein
MFKITSTSPWLRVGSSLAAPYIGNLGALSGTVRFNNNNQNFEVYDGQSWIMFSPSQEISTTGETDQLLQWVRQKMLEETQIEALAKEHPAVHAAYENFKKSADQLKTTIILSTDDHSSN